MNLLFLSLLDFSSLKDRNIYTDLLRQFTMNDHNVYVISPTEKRKKYAPIIEGGHVVIIKPYIGKIQKANLIQKGISMILLEKRLIKSIKANFSNVKFDLILYATPPITFCNAIKYVKKRDKAESYLMLKDIFPQNSVDLGFIKKKGFTCPLFFYFKRKEKKLYQISDHIGCMSKANVNYLKRHNQLKKDIHILPNTMEPNQIVKEECEYWNIRNRYHIPFDKKVFVYGGNLGKPQGIQFLIQLLEENKAKNDRFFLICGDGTEYKNLRNVVEENEYKNVKIMKGLPKGDYEKLLIHCDVGLIFLDRRFTIPNFPSRLLSYMDKELPVLAATDKNTDIGAVIESGQFGFWCEHGDLKTFQKLMDQTLKADLSLMGKNAKRYLLEHYTAEKGYNIILNHLGGK